MTLAADEVVVVIDDEDDDDDDDEDHFADLEGPLNRPILVYLAAVTANLIIGQQSSQQRGNKNASKVKATISDAAINLKRNDFLCQCQ